MIIVKSYAAAVALCYAAALFAEIKTTRKPEVCDA